MSALEEYRKFVPKSGRKNIITIIFVAGMLLGLYLASGAIYRYISGLISPNFTSNTDASQVPPQTYQQDSISINLANYLSELENSSYLQSLLASYFNKSGVNSQQFLQQYASQLASLLGALNGNGFNSNLLNDLPPDAAASLLGQTMFNAYPINPSNPWTNPESTLFKITSYDEYDLSNFNWETSSALSDEGTLPYEAVNSAEEMLLIKDIAQTTSAMNVAIPTLFPSPRIEDYSLASNPVSPSGSLSLDQQVNLGGASVTGNFASGSTDQSTNISYTFLYNSADYQPDSYYQTNSIDMSGYAGADPVVEGCLSGPVSSGTTETWVQYRSANPDFAAVATGLESDPGFMAATNTYSKITAIITYVGNNFQWNPNDPTRPSSGQDPIEWFCQRKSSDRPFEFSSLIVALARTEGISARYVTGYKWNDELAGIYGGTDTENGLTRYPYRIGNTYTWVEAFIPFSSTTGQWQQFDNEFTYNVTTPPINPGNSAFNIQFNGNFPPQIPAYLTYDRSSSPTVSLNLTYNGNQVQYAPIQVVDDSFNQTLFSTSTDENGLASFPLSLLNLSAGIHVINFTTTYGTITYGNITVIDITGPVNIYINPVTPNPIFYPSNLTYNVNGYIWDSVQNGPICGAQVALDLYQNGVDVTSQDISSNQLTTTTNINGNYSFQVNVNPSMVGNFSILSLFSGYFLYDSIPILSSNPTANSALQQFQVINSNSSVFKMYTNGTDSSTINPVVAVRATDWLNFTFTAQQPVGQGVSATIVVTDLLNSTKPICVIAVNNGTGSALIHLSDNIFNWTAGPHYIQAQWLGFPSAGILSQWVVIKAPVAVVQTTQNYGGHTYTIGLSSDTFAIGGYLRDNVTNQNLSGYQIQLGLLNNVGASAQSYLDGPSTTQTVLSPATVYSVSGFYFDVSASAAYAPYQTFTQFNGYWIPSFGSNWQVSWNSYWLNDVNYNQSNASLVDIMVIDPNNATFNAWNDNFIPFSATYTSTNIINKTEGQSYIIVARFLTSNNPTPNAVVQLTDLSQNNREIDGVTNTTHNGTIWGDGYCSFTFAFDASFNPGPHELQLEATYIFNGTITILRYNSTWAYYLPTGGLTLIGMRSNFNNNLTEGNSSSTITFSGSLKDAHGQGLLYANIAFTMYNAGSQVITYSQYLNVNTSFPLSLNVNNNGNFSISFWANSNLALGNYSVQFNFTGTYNLPGGSPSLTLTSPLLIASSTTSPITIQDQPIIFSTYNSTTGTDLQQGITLLGFSGNLENSNGTGIVGENITITIYGSGQNVLWSRNNVTTGAGGYYSINNVLVQWDAAYYIVSYNGSYTKYLLAATTQSIPL